MAWTDPKQMHRLKVSPVLPDDDCFFASDGTDIYRIEVPHDKTREVVARKLSSDRVGLHICTCLGRYRAMSFVDRPAIPFTLIDCFSYPQQHPPSSPPVSDTLETAGLDERPTGVIKRSYTLQEMSYDLGMAFDEQCGRLVITVYKLYGNKWDLRSLVLDFA